MSVKSVRCPYYLATVTALTTLLITPTVTQAQPSASNNAPSIEIFINNFDSLRPADTVSAVPMKSIVSKALSAPTPLPKPVAHARELPKKAVATLPTKPAPQISEHKVIVAQKPVQPQAPKKIAVVASAPKVLPQAAVKQLPVKTIAPIVAAPVVAPAAPAIPKTIAQPAPQPIPQPTAPNNVTNSSVLVLRPSSQPAIVVQPLATPPLPANPTPANPTSTTQNIPTPPPLPKPVIVDATTKNTAVNTLSNPPAPTAETKKAATPPHDTDTIIGIISTVEGWASDKLSSKNKKDSNAALPPPLPMPTAPVPPKPVQASSDNATLPVPNKPTTTQQAALQAKALPPELPIPSPQPPVATGSQKPITLTMPIMLPKPVSTAQAPATPAKPIAKNAVDTTNRNKLYSINFTKSQVSVSDAEQKQLTTQLQSVVNSSKRLTIVSYASIDPDQAGSDRRISLQRAIAVRKYIIGMGIDDMRINVQAMGDTSPDASKDHVDVFTINEPAQ